MKKERLALIVEDDEQIRSLLAFILGREGFNVEIAHDGRMAEQSLGRLAPPDVITLDLMLPYVDGFQLLALIRAHPGWEQVPVIMLTAKSQEKDIARALDAGANDYLVKPFKPEELRARVRRLVRK